MPRKKKLEKPATEMTTEELAQKVFHPKVLEKAKQIAHHGETPPDNSAKSSRR